MQAPIRHAVWGSRGYLVPRANGLVFAGATVENVGFRRRTTKAGVRAMRADGVGAGAAACVSDDAVRVGGAAARDARRHAVHRARSGETNVVAATGHYRNGILLGPITGEMVARGIIDGDWSDVPAEFSPERLLVPA